MAKMARPLESDATLPERPQEESDSSVIKQSQADRQTEDSGEQYGYPEANHSDADRFSDE